MTYAILKKEIATALAIEASVAGLRFAFVESPGIGVFHSCVLK